MKTIVAIADIHFGITQIPPDELYLNLVTRFIAHVKELQPDAILIVGDLYDAKFSLNSEVAIYCNRFMDDLIEACPETEILLLEGTRSHDAGQTANFTHLAKRRGAKFQIVRQTQVVDLAGLKVLGVPEEYHNNKKPYEPFIGEGRGPYDFVTFHGTLEHLAFHAKSGGSRGGQKNKLTFSIDEFAGNVRGLIICGHDHHHSEYKNSVYCGSFTRWKHGEEEPKGFLRLDYDEVKGKVTKKEFIENPDAPLYTTVGIRHVGTDAKTMHAALAKLSRGVRSLRVQVGEEAAPETLATLVSVVADFPNVVVNRTKAKDTLPKRGESAQHEEYEAKVRSYEGLDLVATTMKFAKDELGVEVTRGQIEECLQ
jgi:UDP-2,3-diacylglucosamine pyrophosphatase LpxH